MNKSELRKSYVRVAPRCYGRTNAAALPRFGTQCPAHGLLTRYQRIGVYLAHRAEISTLPLINRTLATKTRVLFADVVIRTRQNAVVQSPCKRANPG